MTLRAMASTLAATLLLAAAPVRPHTAPDAEAGIRELFTRWNAAYRALDARALAALETDDIEIVDRFGHLVRSEGAEFNERLWSAAFTEIYRGKPGPERTIESIRMLTADVAIVQASAMWDEVTLPDGTRIPPHGEIDTFVVVRRDGGWRVAAMNIHNQMRPGTERPGERVPVPQQHREPPEGGAPGAR